MVVDERDALEVGGEVKEDELDLVGADGGVGRCSVDRLVVGWQHAGEFLRDLAGAIDGAVGVNGPGRENPVGAHDKGFSGMVEREAVELDEVLAVGAWRSVDGVGGEAEVCDRVAPDAGIGVWGIGDLVDDHANVGGSVFEVAWEVSGEDLVPVAGRIRVVCKTGFDARTKVCGFIEIGGFVGKVNINGCYVACYRCVRIAEPESILSIVGFVPTFTHMDTLL